MESSTQDIDPEPILETQDIDPEPVLEQIQIDSLLTPEKIERCLDAVNDCIIGSTIRWKKHVAPKWKKIHPSMSKSDFEYLQNLYRNTKAQKKRDARLNQLIPHSERVNVQREPDPELQDPQDEELDPQPHLSAQDVPDDRSHDAQSHLSAQDVSQNESDDDDLFQLKSNKSKEDLLLMTSKDRCWQSRCICLFPQVG